MPTWDDNPFASFYQKKIPKKEEMAAYVVPPTIPFVFKFPNAIGTVVTITNWADLYDPFKNPALIYPVKTEAQYRKFMQLLFIHNGAFIFDQIARHGAFADRWVKAFQAEIPIEDHYLLGLVRSFHFYGTELEITNANDYLTDSKSKNLSQKAKDFFTKVKDTHLTSTTKNFTASNFLCNSLGAFTSWLNWKFDLYAMKCSLGGAKKLSEVRAMLDEGRPFDLKVVYEAAATTGIYEHKETLITMTLNYANRAELYKSFEYSTNVITTVGEKDWTVGAGEPSLYGVELEVCTDYKEQHVIDAFPEIFAICKKDSSITGSKNNKFEIVTIPASLRVQKKMWAAFFKNLNEDMFDVLDKHNNGMHVHIDRKAFDQDMLHQKKFCWFFANPANSQFMLEMSERSKDSLDKYSAIPKAKSVKDGERAIQSNSKNTILNLGKGPTVEVRLFKGIVSWASVIKNLEFVDSVLEFTKTNSMANMNLRGYIKWLEAMPKSAYRTLRLCIEDMNLVDMVMVGQVEELFTSAKGPADVVAKLNHTASKYSKTMIDKIIKMFKENYDAQGCRVTHDIGGFTLIREGTKFAKFNDAVAKMYARS